MSTLRRGAVKDVVLAVVAVLMIGAAVFIYVRRGDKADPAPSDQYMEFRCKGCKQAFQMSHAEFEKVWDKREFVTALDGRNQLYKCQKCGEMLALRVMDNEVP